jgi:hypothetical protein
MNWSRFDIGLASPSVDLVSLAVVAFPSASADSVPPSLRLLLYAFLPAAGTMDTAGRGYSPAHLRLNIGQCTGASNRAKIPTWRRTVQVKNMKFSLRNPALQTEVGNPSGALTCDAPPLIGDRHVDER